MTPPEEKKMGGEMARVVKLEYSDDWAIQFPDGPKDADGEMPIIIPDNPLKESAEMDAEVINKAHAARCKVLVQTLEDLRDGVHYESGIRETARTALEVYRNGK